MVLDQTGSLAGRVVDQRYRPVRGVRVRVPGRDAVMTDGKGEFSMRGLAATERLAVSFSAPGFMDTTKIYRVAGASRGNVVVLWPRAAHVSMDAERGGRLTFHSGTVSFPPRALVDERGRSLRGKVRVAFSSLDVSDGNQLRSAPGDFTARMRGQRVRQLETYGVFEVFVEGADGRRAELAPGRSATVELSVPRTMRRGAPKAAGLYSFDTGEGRWVEEGSLRLAPNRATYAGAVRSVVTTWNADNPVMTTCLRVKVVDANNNAAPGMTVEAEGVTYTGTSPAATTDAMGIACLLVKTGSTVSVTAYDPNTGAHSQSCPVEYLTSSQQADCTNPSACPVEATTLTVAGGAFQDPLNSYDQARWLEANNWTNGPPFDVGWRDDHVAFSGGLMTLQLDKATCPLGCSGMTYASGEYQTRGCYRYGTFEARFQAAAGPGLVSSFFTYTGKFGGPQHHEIDFEIFGKDTQDVQTNYFVAGATHPAPYTLAGFDATTGFHTYKFVWTPSSVEWYVDNMVTPVRTVGSPVPSLPGKIMVNLWAADNSPDGQTLGTLNYQNPLYAYYDWIQYSP